MKTARYNGQVYQVNTLVERLELRAYLNFPLLYIEAYSVLSDPNQRLEYDSTLPTRDALEAFYLRYNPVKLDNAAIETIIENWKGKEVKMFEMLRQKYEIPAHDGVLDLDQRDMIHDERLSGEKRIQIKADHLTSSPVLCQDVGVSGFCTRLRDILCCMTRRATTFKGRYSVLPSELSDDDDD